MCTRKSGVPGHYLTHPYLGPARVVLMVLDFDQSYAIYYCVYAFMHIFSFID